MAKFYDDEEYYGGFEKFSHRKSKSHKKGHQCRSNNSEKKKWAFLNEDDGDNEAPVYPQVSVAPSPAPKAEHQFSEHTHEIKGVKIDFTGVADIQKIENVKDGRKTYGIKFLFKGTKGLFRIIWFNIDMVSRNTTYDTEYAFWLQIRR